MKRNFIAAARVEISFRAHSQLKRLEGPFVLVCLVIVSFGLATGHHPPDPRLSQVSKCPKCLSVALSWP